MYLPVIVSFIVGYYYVVCDPGCVAQDTCDSCIGFASETCVWCSSENFDGKRCQAKTLIDSTWCNNIEDPQNEVTTEANETLTPIVFQNIKSKQRIRKVALMPQHVKVKIRPSEPAIINVTYQLGSDYPIDVYLLMDFSSSMIKQKYILQKQTNMIVQELSMISTNVRIGFGTFVEKPITPLADKKQIEKDQAFVFHNNVPLTSDLEIFSRKTRSLYPNGANHDAPEAGLEALMQVIVCQQEIGWRKEARRIVVLLTNSESHSAGDGRILGAFIPHDMKCHLIDNKYDRNAALTLDYPSLGQINKVAKDNDVLVIFAVDIKVKKYYDLFTAKIEGSKCAVFTSNLSNKIGELYKDKLRSPKLNVKSPPNIDVTLDPPCMDHHTNSKCESKGFESQTVKVSVKVLECFDAAEYKSQVELGVVGINDKLVIEVEPLCHCACEDEGMKTSTNCSSFGTYVCGICKCYGTRSGKFCDCNADTDMNDGNCIKSGDNSICSNRGDCRCGKCENCRQKSHGDFCQYTDHDCSWPGRKVCAGHGDCRYGKCQCHPGWTKDDCTCPNNNRGCIEPYSRKVCSGNGKCHCGKCICNSKSNLMSNTNNSETYAGDFCDDCVDCAQNRCKKLETLVECIFNTTITKENKALCIDNHVQDIEVSITLENRTSMNEDQYRQYAWCGITKDDTVIVFRHKVVYNELYVVIQNEKDLPPQINILVTVLSTIGVMLLVGLVTIVVWKILVDIHDAREYTNFENEIKALGLEDNDVGFCNDELYIPPVFEFKNPMYEESRSTEGKK